MKIELCFGDFLIALEEYFTGLQIDDIGRTDASDDIFTVDQELLDLSVFDLFENRGGELLILLDDDLAALIRPVVIGALTGVEFRVKA